VPNVWLERSLGMSFEGQFCLDRGSIKLNNSGMNSIRWNALVICVALLGLAGRSLSPAQGVAVQEAERQEGPTASLRLPEMDPYGGLLSAHSPNGATGRFRLEKFGDRWSFVTPDGNAFFMLGVYNVTGEGHVDEMGSTYDRRFLAKYGKPEVGWPQVNRRLQSWGFNTIGPFSYRMTLPTNSEPSWPAGKQPVKMPFVALWGNPGITGRFTGAYKNLYQGLDHGLFPGEEGANFPDVFDPGFATFATKQYAHDSDLAGYKNSPWFIGYMSDDTDFLSGFGPGTDFATDPLEKYHWHLGFLALATAPTQGANPYAKPANQAYPDTKVYTKYALRDFLLTRYRTISALNAAWGSRYTTFDSDGGWGTGNGLLDENGREGHTWLGGRAARYYLSGTTSHLKTDLDDFLYELSKKYFATLRTAFKAVAPKTLFLGPTNLGGAGWRAPARGPILKAAGEYLDVLNVGTDTSQAQLDFMARWAGDVPIAIWEGIVANADSSRWRYPRQQSPATWSVPTQQARGEKYKQDIQNLQRGRAATTGSYPFVGLLWWDWCDMFGEQGNFGLVSLADNAYDGREAISQVGTDAWGFKTGGEERNYGDFLTAVRNMNMQVLLTWPH